MNNDEMSKILNIFDKHKPSVLGRNLSSYKAMMWLFNSLRKDVEKVINDLVKGEKK